jgi:DNA-binding transcriptional LysR family regulator
VALVNGRDLLRRELPYRTEKSTIRAVWHRRDEHDEGHAWLREMVAGEALAAQEGLG